MIKWICLCCLNIILLCQTVMGQNFNPFFKTISTGNGLSHKKVNAILQDKRGFLWFGTEDGLNRYDGRYITSFKSLPNVTSSISGNIITDLHEDKSGILWIATSDGGISSYDYRLPSSKQFTRYKHNPHDPKSLPENGISKITEDNRGNLWLATAGSYAVRFNKKTKRFDTPVTKGTRAVLSLMMNGDTLMVGRAGGGLMKINTKTLAYSEDLRYDDLYANMPHASISSIFKDSHRNIWYGSWDEKVFRVSASDGKEQAFNPGPKNPSAPADDIVSFAEDKVGQIWMAGKSTGVYIYDPEGRRFINLRSDAKVEGTLADDQVNAVYIGHDGIVWIGTNNGISMYNPLFAPFVQQWLPAKEDIVTYDFFKNEQGQLLIGTSEGIFIKSPGRVSLDHRKLYYNGQKLAVTKFFRDADGTFYIGTDYTLFTYNLTTNKVSPLPDTENDPVMKKLISSRVVSIVRDTLNSHPVLIVSPYGHYITYYDLQEKKWVSRKDISQNIIQKYGLKDNLVRKFYKDSSGKLWLANFKAGLGNWLPEQDPTVNYFINDPTNYHSLSSNDVFDILEDKKGNFWVSTYGGGINYLEAKTGKFTHIAESTNLSEGLQAGPDGKLWMLCNGHIHKYDPVKKVYTCYDLPHLHSTGGVNGYLYKDNGGNLYAAGKNYYISFNPSQIRAINYEPEVFFTDFKIFSQSHSQLLQNNKIELTHDKNFFSVVFSAPDYSGDNIHYAYKLEGIDQNWIEAGKANSVQYTNLPGGSYVLKVRASNWKGGYVSKFKSLNIVIIPPFWLQWWFYAALFVVTFSLTYVFYRYRMNTLLEQQAIRNGIAQDLHDQVGSILSSISVYSEVAKIYQVNGETSKLRNLLDTISNVSSEMISEMGDIVWAINPKNDHFNSIFNRIVNYADPLCKASDIRFDFKCDQKLLDSNLGMQTRKNLYLIIKEAINNAIKHAQCNSLAVRISLYNEVAELSIIDDGIGFECDVEPNDSGSDGGNGLNNMSFRSRELKADLTVESQPGQGSKIKLVFKVQ